MKELDLDIDIEVLEDRIAPSLLSVNLLVNGCRYIRGIFMDSAGVRALRANNVVVVDTGIKPV